MAYKRKSARAPARKRKYARRAPIPRAVRSQQLSCVRRQFLENFTVSRALGWTNTVFTFRLSDLPNYGEFTSLFEEFRINAVRLQFLPQGTSIDTPQNSANYAAGNSWMYRPRIYTLVDKDGDSNTSTEANMLQCGAARLVPNSVSPFSIYIKNPAIALETQTSLGFSAAVSKSRQWIDTKNYGVNHFGCAVGGLIPDGSASMSYQYGVVATYYLQFRGTQ